MAIKAQAVVKFLADQTPPKGMSNEPTEWTIFVDRAVIKRGSGIGIVMIRQNKEKIE